MHFMMNDDEASENAAQDNISTSSRGRESRPSWYQRLKLQRDPWLRSLRRYWARYLFSGTLLLGQAPLLVCRSLLLPPEDRIMVSIACWALASFHFLVHWTLVPELPPWFATDTGMPLYNDEDLERYAGE